MTAVLYFIRMREEQAKMATAKTAAHQTALRTEIEHLREQMQAMRDEREMEASKQGSKASQDAAVRRLDNERQYLKSQLASEVTLKNELHEALFKCQQQLAETQVQWREDVDTLKEATTSTLKESTDAQKRIHQTALSLETEVARLTQQNTELKEGFNKMRDQVRLEQLALENTTSANHRLVEHAEQLRRDIECLKLLESQATEQHELQLKTMQTLMHERDENYANNLSVLRQVTLEYVLYRVCAV